MPQKENTLDAQLLDIMLRAGSRWVLWLLLTLSLLAVAVMVERIWFFFQEKQSRKTLDAAMAALPRTGAAAALAILGEAKSMQAAVVRAGLANAGDGAASVEEHIAATVESERLRYERGLAFLGTLGSNAPFVGLFGTVLGIIRAFHDLAANSAQGAQAVMAGIAEALVATAVGLLVAIPAVAAYNAFSRHVETAAAAAGGLGHSVLAYIKVEKPKAEKTSNANGAA